MGSVEATMKDDVAAFTTQNRIWGSGTIYLY